MRVTLAILILSLLFLPVNSGAQSPNASIRGIVLDPDGRRVPGAEIIVLSDATGVKYVTSTNDDGFYIVENLPPGSYRIQVSKFGFKGIIKPDLILNVQDGLSLNFTLSVGASAVTVTVEGGAPMLNTTDATVSTVVDRQFAENLPMNGRSFQTLLYLTPGVVATPSNNSDNGQFSVNGQRAASNYWMVDGVSANIGVGASGGAGGGNGLGGTLGSFSVLGGTNSLVSVDAMQEFRLQTSTFAPEFGRTPGGQISIFTRPGKNQFHGTAFDYLRNDKLDAANWFNGYTNNPPLPKAEERQNDFGGTFSGPLVKERAFFFFSYEGLRLRLPQTSLTSVPDLVARQNAVPSMQPYLNAFPLPNGADNPLTGTAQLDATYSNPASLDAYSLRGDYHWNNRVTLFGRYNYSPSQFEARGTSSGNAALSTVERSLINTQTATGGVTWTMTQAMANDLRINYSRTNAEANTFQDNFAGAVPLATLPFPDAFTSKNAFFSVSIFSLSHGFSLPVGPEAKIVQRQLNIVDGLTWQKGAHALKFGADYRRLAPIMTPLEYQQVVTFRNIPLAQSGQASGGNVYSYASTTILFRNLGLYAQDTWHISSRLTATYGVRWDVDVAPKSLDGPSIPAVTGFNLNNLSGLAIAPPGTPAFSTTYGNFAPRIGGAYELVQGPSWSTVLRGGFGVFYDLVSSETGNSLSNGYPPFGNFRAFVNVPFPFSDAQIAPPPIPSTATISRFATFNPNLKLPFTLEWNFALEQALGKDQSVSATYLGASGRRLLQSTQFFSPTTNPAIAQGRFVDNTASSSYNALQLQFRRRLSHGLQALSSYTWSHSIDDGSAASYGFTSNLGGLGSKGTNWGNSDFDIRHTFTTGLTYDLPYSHRLRFLRPLLRDWSVESFLLARSAPPVTLDDQNFFELDGGVYADIHPDVVPGQPLYLYGPQFPGGKAFNPAAFSDPPVDAITGNPTRQGTLPRNKLRGFGATQVDLAVHRDFPLREQWKLQFRCEAFNVLNHPNFGPPNNEFGGGGFGLSNQMLAQSLSQQTLGGGGFDPLYQIGGPRSIQLALKVIF